MLGLGPPTSPASDERRRIAREIHDVVAHSLTVTMLHLTAARYILSRDPEGSWISPRHW
jgi:signal transduction histidine kinase